MTFICTLFTDFASLENLENSLKTFFNLLIFCRLSLLCCACTNDKRNVVIKTAASVLIRQQKTKIKN